ncbi:hypothetical protein FDECE_7409 [Fusarium decemcellulare]|nr:hypothetical protein FDECE_7409 [Fusarium decemcellulare]
MSSFKLTPYPNLRHNQGGRGYPQSEGLQGVELTPRSQKLCDDLLKVTEKPKILEMLMMVLTVHSRSSKPKADPAEDPSSRGDKVVLGQETWQTQRSSQKTSVNVRSHQKTIEKDVKVARVELDKKHTEDGISWVSIKAIIDERKADVEKRLKEGQLDEVKNPIPSGCSKRKPESLCKPGKEDPPQEYFRAFKGCNWDNMLKAN